MRILGVLLVVWLVAAVFVYPPLVEGSDGECSALEQRYADIGSRDGSLLRLGTYFGSSSSEPGAVAFAKDNYPLLPPAIGCTLAFWRTVIGKPAPVAAVAALPPPAAASPEPLPVEEPARPSAGVIPTLSRDITPNAGPISPGTIFTLPMETVAIRVETPGGRPAGGRFQLLQGRAVLSSCRAEYAAPGTAWCKFNISLRKGNYTIAFFGNNGLLGQFPFTVIGR